MRRLATRLRRHATYANVVSSLCLFMVLSTGTAVAAKALIDGRNLRNESVTGAKVRNGSLEAADLSVKARAALKGAKGAKGATGAAGPAGKDGTAGAKGDTGPQGVPGAKGEKGDPGGGGAVTIHDLHGTPCTRPGGAAGTFKVVVAATLSEEATVTMKCSGPVPPYHASADAWEPNDSEGAASNLTVFPSTLGSTDIAVVNDLTIHDAADVDWYTFTLACDDMHGMGGSAVINPLLLSATPSDAPEIDAAIWHNGTPVGEAQWGGWRVNTGPLCVVGGVYQSNTHTFTIRVRSKDGHKSKYRISATGSYSVIP